MSLDLPLLSGIFGMIMILAAFLLLQTHRISQDDLSYDALNFFGSALLVAYGIAGRVWPFVILNAIFALFSLKEVIVDLTRGSKK